MGQDPAFCSLAIASSSLITKTASVVFVVVFTFRLAVFFISTEILLTAKYECCIHLVDKRKKKRPVLLMFSDLVQCGDMWLIKAITSALFGLSTAMDI